MKNAVDKLVGSVLPNPTGGGGGGGGGSNFLGAGLRWLGGALGGGQATGGPVTGGSGIRDDVPTMLMGGEYVVRKSAVKRYGPEFLEALNRGGIQTMQQGGFFTPGTYGQGTITGKRDLLRFAAQSHTMGAQDQIVGDAGFGSVALEPQSVRLTHFGRRGKKSLAEQESKRQAFGIYLQQIQAEEAAKEAERQRKKEFKNALKMAVISAGINQFATGFSESMKASKGTGQGMFSRLSSATGSGFTGFEGRQGVRHGGLLNIFSNSNAPLPSAQRQRDVAGIPSHINNNSSGEIIMESLRDGVSPPAVPYPEGGAETDWSILPKKQATGGYIPRTAGIDTVPVDASGGEFMINAAATERVGRGNLAALNSGGGGNGGDDAIVAAINNLGDELGGRGETVINITVNSDGTQTQDSNGGEEDQNLAARLGDSVRQIIAEEQRLGGSLRRV